MRVLLDIRMKDLSPEERQELDDYVEKLVADYVSAEHRFIELAFEMGPQENMTEQDLKDYITYLGKMRLNWYGTVEWDDVPENPLDWMSWMLGGRKHANFFEVKVTSYDHSGLIGEVDFTKYYPYLSTRTM